MNRIVATLTACLALAIGPRLFAAESGALPDGLYAEVTTPRGVIVSELFYKKAPMTCANFVGLAEGTLGPAPRKPFYDGLTFCRVVPGFVLQGGDNVRPDKSDVGYWFPNEIVPGLRFDGAGVMSMGNEDDPNTNGSEFCFMLGPAPHLDYAFPIFGHVVRGLEVLPLIKKGDPMQVKILRLGSEAKNFRADEKTFSALVARAPGCRRRTSATGPSRCSRPTSRGVSNTSRPNSPTSSSSPARNFTSGSAIASIRFFPARRFSKARRPIARA